jgi:hypothetical protein
MTDEIVNILCGKCKVEVEGPTEPDAKSTYSCPSCGNSDTFEKVMASVEAFTEELVGRSFHKTAEDIFRDSIVQVTSSSPQKKTYPFITDMRL